MFTKYRIALFLCELLLLFASCFPGGQTTPVSMMIPSASENKSEYPTDDWRSAQPEEQGMDSTALQQMFETIEAQPITVHGVVIVRNGYIVAEKYYSPYKQDTSHELYSCTKSFISALVGIAIAEGNLKGAHETVQACLPAYDFAQSDPRKATMTVEHLLTMSSGLDWPESDPIYQQLWRSPDWVQFVLDRPLVYAPGEKFNYNSGCSHVLSAIIAERTGKLTQHFAQERLFTPLGMTSAHWELNPDGLAIGGWGLELTPRDMAKFGYLYLHKGRWNEQQIVPAAWVEESVTPHIEAGEKFEYGYQWWIYSKWGAYAARGRYGQLIFVIPQYEMVIVFTAGENDDQRLIALIETYIVPAVQSTD